MRRFFVSCGERSGLEVVQGWAARRNYDEVIRLVGWDNMTTDHDPTTATMIVAEEPERTEIPSFLEALGVLRDWAIQSRFDAGFSNSMYGWTGSLAIDDLVSRIGEVWLAFMAHGEPGKFPPSLAQLRVRASQPGAVLRAEIVRDAVSCAITEMNMSGANVPVEANPTTPTTLDIAWEQVTRTLGTMHAASNEGWVKVSVAAEQFRRLGFIESVIDFPPAYKAAKTALTLAQSRLASYIQLSLLELGLKALEAEIATVKPEK